MNKVSPLCGAAECVFIAPQADEAERLLRADLPSPQKASVKREHGKSNCIIGFKAIALNS
jgi:hypothetical protein